MGRQLKRVALDFEWPLEMLWKGYVCPYQAQNCMACDQTGYNPETKQIADDFYDFDRTGRRWKDKITQDEVDALVAKGRLRHWDKGWQTIPRTAAEVNAANSSNSSMLVEMAHDGINRGVLIQARASRLGVYGLCSFCNGTGAIYATPEIEKLAGEWKPFHPPAGPGYQLWSTTTEGHPMSPVFNNLEALCGWLDTSKTSVFGYDTATAAEWKQMLQNNQVAVVSKNADGSTNTFI